MTKKDLVDFLEPFEDDIQVVALDAPPCFEYSEITPVYRVATSKDLTYAGHLPITKGDGFVALKLK